MTTPVPDRKASELIIGESTVRKTVRELKKDLRKQMKGTLSSLEDLDVSKQSGDVEAALLSLQQYRDCRSISIFMSMPKGEIQTKSIVNHALRAGKDVYIPYIYQSNADSSGRGSSTMDMLQLRDEEDYKSLRPDAWGIPSIDARSVAARKNACGGKGITDGQSTVMEGTGLDVVLMPGVVFDGGLNRLGHGKGFYDKFLARYVSSLSTDTGRREKPFLIGLALRDQMLPPGHRVPIEPWDCPLDAVVFGSEVISDHR